ncbi:RNA chaperone ProQ [Thalassotalea sp. LPB0316]|uniref:RNA chaperone ProQ n=1 Tax=Thalassotalea sp. LPB0316 TaxID=2769490 RepID=UPI001868F8D2|nr:RNA chaperone ProQ [Thalassotalea sp. LPB0316]QOL24999.1 RNA chaperone ProQ [Thalassotalea sp. LPB0316]
MENKRNTSKEIIALLVEKFPACFSIEGPAKPLKVGIFQDLAEQLAEDETVSKTRLRQALRHYTSSWRYLKSVKVGSHRVDLLGEQVAEIDQEQADYAAKTLKESQEKFGNKNTKAKSEGQKNSAKTGQAPKNKGVADKKQKFKNVKSTKRVAKKPQEPVNLTPIDSSTVKEGAKVKVKFGNAPMDAVITEVDGNDVHVQLQSGMVIKTQVENIFS